MTQIPRTLFCNFDLQFKQISKFQKNPDRVLKDLDDDVVAQESSSSSKVPTKKLKKQVSVVSVSDTEELTAATAARGLGPSSAELRKKAEALTNQTIPSTKGGIKNAVLKKPKGCPFAKNKMVSGYVKDVESFKASLLKNGWTFKMTEIRKS